MNTIQFELWNLLQVHICESTVRKESVATLNVVVLVTTGGDGWEADLDWTIR